MYLALLLQVIIFLYDHYTLSFFSITFYSIKMKYSYAMKLIGGGVRVGELPKSSGILQ